ncbi:putative phage tail protein [Cytobacillus sp.]|uniref:putative phage tail protein n=1 Tax=Cytobacillus sp. TaxID=2675269 RepID=UPI0028BE5F0A|nr:putative phage tail protein [Cytobacillus sp.]
MARDVDILSYLPSILRDIKELIEIAQVEKPALEAIWKNIENALNNQFVVSANESGLSRYEKMLKISSPATDSIETRRFRILTRYQEQAPYTWKLLKQLLDNLLGEGQYELKRDVATKTISVKIELTVKGQFDAVVVMLERITPQNMVLDVQLRYNQHITLAKFTHEQLALYTHEQLRSEVLI